MRRVPRCARPHAPGPLVREAFAIRAPGENRAKPRGCMCCAVLCLLNKKRAVWGPQQPFLETNPTQAFAHVRHQREATPQSNPPKGEAVTGRRHSGRTFGQGISIKPGARSTAGPAAVHKGLGVQVAQGRGFGTRTRYSPAGRARAHVNGAACFPARSAPTPPPTPNSTRHPPRGHSGSRPLRRVRDRVQRWGPACPTSTPQDQMAASSGHANRAHGLASVRRPSSKRFVCDARQRRVVGNASPATRRAWLGGWGPDAPAA